MRSTFLLIALPFMSAFVGTIMALAVAAPSLVEAQAENVRVRADMWSLLGPGDNERVRLTTAPGTQGTVSVLSVNGTVRAQMATGGTTGSIGAVGANPVAAGFNLNGPDGVRIARLGTTPPPDDPTGYGGVNLQLFDKEGKMRMRLLVDDNGAPSIQFLDADGNVTWSQH